MSKKPRVETDLEEAARADELADLEDESVEIVTEEPSSPAKQYRVIARGGFWDGVKLHPKGSIVTYAGPVKENSESLEPV